MEKPSVQIFAYIVGVLSIWFVGTSIVHWVGGKGTCGGGSQKGVCRAWFALKRDPEGTRISWEEPAQRRTLVVLSRKDGSERGCGRPAENPIAGGRYMGPHLIFLSGLTHLLLWLQVPLL